MTRPTTPADANELLACTVSLRSLIRDLVADESAVEDVIQETRLEMLRREPVGDRLRWARAMARNLARKVRRSEKRRLQRERAVAQDEAVPSAADAAARLEKLRALIDALHALPGPYRDVLCRRYLDGVPPRTIARDLGLPLGTVKTRLKRALQDVRDGLDRDHGGSRRAWSLPLLSCSPSAAGASVGGTSAAAGVALGVLVMKTKIAFALALVCVVGAAWIGWDLFVGEGGAERTRAPAQGPGVADAAVRTSPSEVDAPLEIAPFRELDAASGAQPPSQDRGWRLRGTVRFRSGMPIAEAPIGVFREGPEDVGRGWARGRTDALGAFSLDMGEAASLRSSSVTINGSAVRIEEGLPVPPPEGKGETTWDVVVPDLARVVGEVVDRGGRPVGGIGFDIEISNKRAMVNASRMVFSRADGRFELTVPCEGVRRLRVWPRLRPDETSADGSGLAAIRTKTLTTDGVPEGSFLLFRPLERSGLDQEMWPIRPRADVNVVSGGTVDVGRFVVAPLGALEFLLVDDGDGTPVVDAEVRIICPVRGAYVLSHATDAGGITRLEHLPGPHVIKPDIRSGSLRYTVADRAARVDGIPVDVPSLGTARVTVRVQRGLPWPETPASGPRWVIVMGAYGEPLRGARVAWGGQEVVTDQEGRATLERTEHSRADLRVTLSGYRDHEQRNAEFDALHTIGLQPEGVAILRVRDAAGGAVGDILMTRQEGTREFVGLPKELRAGDGNHEIPPLAPGGRVASFFVWSRSQGTARIDFPHGIREGEVIDVKLSPVQEISGRVLDRAGDPVAEADIFGSAPGLLVDLTSALRGSGRSFKQLEGHTCTGVARTSPDGTFHILAPSTDGLLVVLAGSRGGTLYRYSTARAVDVVTIDAATPVTIHRSGPSPVEQTVRLFSSHPEIRMWVGERWPASDPSTTILAPLPGPYRVNLLRESGADGQWVGISGSARVDVTGGPTPIAVTLTEGSHPR